jgi:hypothetical protein
VDYRISGLHTAGVTGSIPVPPTIKIKHLSDAKQLFAPVADKGGRHTEADEHATREIERLQAA